MNYIICKDPTPFISLGEYNYCGLEDMILPDIIAIDSETGGLEARKQDIFCIQLGTGENNYLIKMYDNEYTFYDLIPYLEGKTLVFHNALFDLGFFYKYNFFPSDVKDTMLASKIIYNGDTDNIRNDFGAVMERELGIKYDKTEQKNIAQVKLTTVTSIAYCFQDVNRLVELHDALQEKIIAGGFEETYKLHCKYIRALAYIEQCGLPISSEMWKAKMEEDIKNTFFWKKKIEEYIYDHIPDYQDSQLDLFNPQKRIEINITSPIQMLKVFAKLGIPTKDKDGKDSINENIISKSKHEFVEMWLGFQEANHRVSTFGDKILQKIENERIYTNFNPMVDTARLSTRKGHINFLNFPKDKETRSCFTCKKGNVMVVCDLAGQENVLSADFTKDKAMMMAVKENKDLHCMLTRVLNPSLADKTDEEIMTFYKSERQASKPIRFAFAYGGNAFTIHQNGNIPYDQALEIEKKYKDLHNGIYIWGSRIYTKSVDNGYIESVMGWKLKLPEFSKFLSLKEKVESITKTEWERYKQGKIEYLALKKDEKYNVKIWQNLELYKEKKKVVSAFFKLKSEYQRLCLNSPIQTAGAHQIKLATYLFFEWILKNDYINSVLIVNSIHDELVIECEEPLKLLVKKNLERCMKEGANFFLFELKCDASANIGNSWFSAK